MKLTTIIIINSIFITSILSMGYAQENNGPKKIIYETDMCLDVDDVGALAVLHALADMGEVEILAVCFNEEHPNGPGTIDAINTWYGHGDIPIGIYKGDLDNDWSSVSSYLNYIDNNFPNDIDKASADSAVTVYRQILSEQPDSSVTIISVGFLNNLNDLLLAEPELIEQKVVELVIMAGVNNDGFNFVMHNLVDVSQNVLENWPTPIVVSQEGGSIYTGDNLSTAPIESPVRWSYYKWFDNSFQGRSSWDQMAALYGVRGLSTYFDMITTGSGSLSNGYSYPMVPGWRTYLDTKNSVSNSDFEQIIEDLMDMLPPGFPLVTITSPQNNASFESGADIIIEADASDSEGSIEKVEFFDNMNKIGEDTTDPYSVELQNASDGIHHLTAVVTDNENNYSSSNEVIILVGEINAFLVGHWEFENDAADASDYNNDGNISGSPDYVTGKIGSALNFNNDQDLITIPATSDFSTTSFTLAVWVKLPNPIPGGWRTIIEHNRWGSNWFGLWKSDNANKFHFRWGSDASADFSSTISADTWYHVAATFDAGQKTAKLYLNGDLDKTIQNTQVPSVENAEILIGRNEDGEESFKGIIDDLRVYNRALDQSEISDLVNVTSIDDQIEFRDGSLPEKYSLINYPNPFNPSTVINYELPTTNYVELSIYNLVGQKVATLVSENHPAGNYSVEWNASGHASGVYYYELRTNDFRDVKKMVLMK